MDHHSLRKLWKDFWLKRMHKHIEPTSLVTSSQDSTALFVVAGMQQLVPFFSGAAHEQGEKLFNVQKCLRTNDIEEIGDERHLSLFEMMGNRSLGDYFAKESLSRSYEFLIDYVGLDPQRLGCSIFGGYVNEDGQEIIPYDRDAESILTHLGMDSSRIKAIPMQEGVKCDNFWGPAGKVGPCGPSAEFHYDRGDEYGPNDRAIGTNDRFIEIWNNVFMCYYKHEDGTFGVLDKQNIDTGMGLERLMMVIEESETLFDTSLFEPLIASISHATDTRYQESVNIIQSYRIVIDHIRSVVCLLADGVFPSNDMRGYVLRKLIRRMVFHFDHVLGADILSWLEIGVSLVLEQLQPYYVSLESVSKDSLVECISHEVAKFQKTLQTGTQLVHKKIADIDGRTLLGDVVFQLYDTYGFPVDLTREIAAREGYTIDEEGYNEAMAAAKLQSKQGASQTFAKGIDRASYIDGVVATEFVGYDMMTLEDPQLLKQFVIDDEHYMIFDRTPFFPTGGGQQHDIGCIVIDDDRYYVVDVIRYEHVIIHHVSTAA